MEVATRTEIIEATNQALCKHGYAGLTMQRIAAESAMTTAAIHYHFDTKEDLLNAFLDELLERFETKLACDASDPRERLNAFLDVIFTPSDPTADEFPVPIMELKAQAPYHDIFRERFLDLDEVMRREVTEIVDEGINAGYFEETDPDEIARLVTTVTNGEHARTVALGEQSDKTRKVLEHTLELHLGWEPGSGVVA